MVKENSNYLEMNFKKEPFLDHYDVFEVIGKGHFAVVKRCVNKATGSEYAGKFIRKKRVCRGVPPEDIEREVETLSRLEHPGIIQFHDVYDTGQFVVLLFELVTGGELFEFISLRKNLTEEQSIHIVRQIIEAVSHMHSLNIAHLDLKPENVLLVEKVDLPTVKVIDFGLSLRLDTVVEVKAMFGTPEFMAPEIVNFENLTLATDMWAIGVITYILLSGGASPFLGDTVQDTYTNISSATFKFDNDYFESVSEAAKDFIIKLLQKDPKKRNSVFDCQKHPWLQNKVTEIFTPPISLLSAINEGNLNEFEDILNSGNIDVNQTNKNGATGLHLAAATGQTEMARLLLMCGANVSISDWQGDTPLIHASRHASTDILGMLIKAGACISVQNHEGDTALHVAAAWGELEVTKILIENGALLHIPNHLGQLPIHIAIHRRHTNVALFLLNSGSEFDIHDCEGNAPIHLAVREGLLSVVNALCSMGCNIDAANNQGLCPIHIAARLGHIDVVRCLCLMGCNTEIKNSDGIKAEITALKYGFNDISDLLNKIKSNYVRDVYIRQLIPTGQPLPRFNIQVFGHSAVGKSTLLDTMRTGYFSGFFKRTKTNHFNTKYAPLLGTLSQPNSPTRTHIELDSTSRQNSLNFDTYNHHSTHGIDVQQAWISGVGYVTLWDFSGQDTYFCFYHHMITTSASHAVIVLVFSLNDSPTIQYKQCSFWLSFLQARIPPTEPIGSCGKTNNMPKIILVATHADVVRAPKLTNGDFNSPQAQDLTKRLRAEFSSHFDIHPTPIVVDAHIPNSYGVKLLKSTLSELKTSMWQGLRSMNGFTEAIVSWLPMLRKSAESIPVMTWEAFIAEARNQVNPLASNDHFSILFSHLEQMGEVIIVGDLIILSPSWLCGQVLGQILSIDFITHARITGCYTVEDFQVAFPEADSMAMLEVLEALQLCIQCDNDGELEYEFPCYNLVERIEGLWECSDCRYKDGAYGGVRLKTPENTTHLIHCIFPRLQVELRKTVLCYYDWQSDLYQWMGGSKLCFGAIESIITFETEPDSGDECIEIKVRGPAGSGKNCFLFMEELLGIIDMVLLDIVPGLLMEKHTLSAYDLRTHASPVYCYAPDVLMKASLESKGFETMVTNPLANTSETILELISFGMEEEVQKLVCNAYEINVDMLSTLCMQQVCAMLDPPDPHGRDWCLLAVQLGLTNKLSVIENTSHSRTASTLHQLACQVDNSIGFLINKLKGLGREDVAKFLMKYAPLYKVNGEEIQVQAQQLADNSRNL
ncbi:death-associated protein kinase 1-like isoform X2 [Cimex lectularius]|uniref:Non-specific serine/threonine protein kinase n=1 Tax=Cimex lectularius TaxID=79782 RepID=A0A8I6TF51_CIMLE|nr:death-associated protein kinase 1-like isoform X2 [Cimex lectularius]